MDTAQKMLKKIDYSLEVEKPTTLSTADDALKKFKNRRLWQPQRSVGRKSFKYINILRAEEAYKNLYKKFRSEGQEIITKFPFRGSMMFTKNWCLEVG